MHKTNEAFDAAHPWKESLELQADGAGQVSVWVLSSDVINTPKLQAILKPVAAPKEPMKLGEIGCDFAKDFQIRRFGLRAFPYQTEDTGWVFNLGVFTKEDQTTPAKVYLKHQINTGIAVDSTYFDLDRSPRSQLNDDGNWQFVNGHQMRVRIAEVVPQEGSTIDGEIRDYATLLNSDGNPVDSLEITTENDGAAQFRLRSGPYINSAATIILEAQELTQQGEN